MGKFTIDNSGRGNCMYYAYSISLMYYLLKKREPKIAENIFTKLALSPAQQQQLHNLLNDKTISRFSEEHITKIIEPILGAATRKITSIQVKAQFIKEPLSSSLFNAANYGMVYLFRRELEKNKSVLSRLLIDNNFDNPDYSAAEFYKVFNIKIPNSKLHRHIKQHYYALLEKNTKGWPERVEQIYPERQKTLKRYIDENYEYQQQFINELLWEGKLDFLNVINKFSDEWEGFIAEIHQNNNEVTKAAIESNPLFQYQFLQLLLPKRKINFREATERFPEEWTKYVDKLCEERTFTREEIITHNIYQQRFRKEIEDKINLKFEDVIHQHRDEWSARVEHIYAAKKESVGKAATTNDVFYQEQFLTDLIKEVTIEFFKANNNANLDQYQAHLNVNFQWGSEENLLLLHDYLQGKREFRDNNDLVQREYDTEILLEIYEDWLPKSGAPTQRPDMVLNNLHNVHWVSIVESENSTPVIVKNPSEQRMEQLKLCGFNAYLQKLSDKHKELEVKDSLASDEAKHIFDKLFAVREQFITEESNMSPAEFAEECQDILDSSSTAHLQIHRGIGLILNGLINAAVFMANMFIGAGNLFYGRFELIDFNLLPTDSIKQVQSLENSVKALIKIRMIEDKKSYEDLSLFDNDLILSGGYNCN